MLKSLRRNILPIYNGVQQIRFNSTKLVDLTVNNQGIATVTMQRKPVNGLNLELFTALHETFEQVENDRAKGMILTSANETVFSAGFDIMELYKPNPEKLKNFYSTVQDVWQKLYGFGIPTAAVINGHSPGGGCVLAMTCEYRVMLNNYTIGLNETKLGIVVPEYVIATMRNIISNRQTELFLTSGTLFKTEEALAVGLIDATANDKAEAIAKTDNFFKRFAKINPLVRQMTKTACRKRDLEYFKDTRDADLQKFLFMINQPIFQQGLGQYIDGLKKAQK